VAKTQRTSIVPVEHITQSILVFRGHRVLLDTDLAELYGVATKVLLQAVRRNQERFPEDFMIRLTAAEWAALRSRIVTLETGRGQHRKYLPSKCAWIKRSPSTMRLSPLFSPRSASS
jgi:hypothetical protein